MSTITELRILPPPQMGNMPQVTVPEPIRMNNMFSEGRWVPSPNPLVIGPKNFADVANVRWRYGTLEATSGNALLTTAAMNAVYYIPCSAIQIRTPLAAVKSRVLVEASNALGTASKIYENRAVIPAAGNFEATEIFTPAAMPGRFCQWPLNHVAYFNGAESCIYGGDEVPVGAFITTSVADTVTNPVDYTEQVRNFIDTAEESAVIGGEATSTSTLIHMNGAIGSASFTDSIGSKTITVTNALIKADEFKFNGSSGYFASANLSMADNVCFQFGAAENLIIDFWVMHKSALPALPYFFTYHADGNNYFSMHRDGTSLIVTVVVASSTLLQFSCPYPTVYDAWEHICLVRNFASVTPDWYLFLDGVPQALTLIAGSYSATLPTTYTTPTFNIGSFAGASNFILGWMAEFRLGKGGLEATGGNALGFTPKTIPYSTASRIFYIMSPRPLEAVNFEMFQPCSRFIPATGLAGKEWNGGAWTALTVTANTTIITGVALAQDGTLSFTSTANTSKPRYMNGQEGYWYQFVLSKNECLIGRVTVSPAMQPVRNVWSGEEMVIGGFKVYDGTKYDDYTDYVNDESSATTTDTALKSMASTKSIYVFTKVRAQGIKLRFTGINGTAAVILLERYQNGGFVAASYVDDGTSKDGKSFAQSGMVSFSNDKQDRQLSVDGSDPYYCYRLSFNGATLGADTEIYWVTAIQAPDEVGPYAFGFSYRNRAFMAVSGNELNRVDYGEQGKVDVFNGSDSSFGIDNNPLYFGANEALTAACELYNKVASSLYHVAVITQNTATHILNGTGPGDYQVLQVSPELGCPAHDTMVSAEIVGDDGIARNVLFWLSYEGPVFFDMGSLLPLPGLEYYFDQNNTAVCVDLSRISKSQGKFDRRNMEYNLVVPVGSAGWMWVAYQVLEKKWIRKNVDIDLDDNLIYPQITLTVKDLNGRQYPYGLYDSGFMSLLDSGPKWYAYDPSTAAVVSHAMSHYVDTASLLPSGLWDVTCLATLKLVSSSLPLELAGAIAIDHYSNGKPAENSDFSALVTTIGDEWAKTTQVCSILGWSHKFRFSIDTSIIPVGCRLIAWAAEFDKIHEDVIDSTAATDPMYLADGTYTSDGSIGGAASGGAP